MSGRSGGRIPMMSGSISSWGKDNAAYLTVIFPGSQVKEEDAVRKAARKTAKGAKATHK